MSVHGTIPATAYTFAKAGTFNASVVVADRASHTSSTAKFTVTVTASPATGSISGKVFDDVNSNGLRDAGEAGLGLFTVELETTASVILAKATTDVLGDFTFADLAAGTYVLKVVPVTGLAATEPTGGTMTITLTASEIESGLLFGEKATS